MRKITRISCLVALSTLFAVQPLLAQTPVVKVSYRHQVSTQGLFAFGPLELATPGLSNDGTRLLVGTSKGDLLLFDTVTGDLLKSRTLVGGVVASPVFHRESALVGTNDGRVYRLDAATLEDQWKEPAALKGAVVVPPRVLGNVVLIHDERSVLQALDLATGEKVATFDAQSFARRGLSPFTIFGYPDLAIGDGALFAGFETGTVLRFNVEGAGLSSFAPAWEEGICTAGAIKTSDEAGQARLCSPRRVFRDVDASPTLTASGLLTGCYCRGLIMLDPETGKVLWEKPILGPSSPVVVGDHALFTAADGYLYAAALADGKIRWRTRLDATLLSRPTVLGAAGDLPSAVVAVASGESLYVVNAGNGSIAARFDSLGGVAAAPAAAGNVLFILSNEGYLYRLDYFR